MRRKEGYHRSDSGLSWQPSDRQRRVLDLLAEGRTNPEIASALGMSIDGAKWHVGMLLAETGLDDRQALARWWVDKQADDRRPALGAPHLLRLRSLWPAFAMSLIAIAMVLRLTTGGSDSEPAASLEALTDFGASTQTADTASFAGPPPSCDMPLPPDFRSVAEDELTTQGFISVGGRLLESSGCPLKISNRADRSIAWLSDGGFIANIVTFEGEDWELEVAQLDEADAAGYVNRKIGSHVYRRSEQGAFLIVQARHLSTREVRPIALDSRGWLYFGPELVPADYVVEEWTGDRLDVDEARVLRRLRPGGRPGEECRSVNCPTISSALSTISISKGGFYLNSCAGGPCTVSYRPGDTQLLAPVAGNLRCLAAGEAGGTYNGDVMELDAGNFVLRFRELDTAGGAPADRTSAVSCEVREVEAGELIGLHYHYGIEAIGPQGTPISVAASEDSTLYVGDFTNELGCPCTQGK